jgi:hypothetical protein
MTQQGTQGWVVIDIRRYRGSTSSSNDLCLIASQSSVSFWARLIELICSPSSNRGLPHFRGYRVVNRVQSGYGIPELLLNSRLR